MFQKIIVPLDSSDLSERALSVATSIAEAVGGAVSICSSVDPKDQAKFNAYWALGGDMDSGIGALPPEGLVRTEPEREAETEQYLSKVKSDNGKLASSDVTILIGDPSEEILTHAHAQGAGLIVMGS
jgi:nucleotide-binding universal stress UspA family protein